MNIINFLSTKATFLKNWVSIALISAIILPYAALVPVTAYAKNTAASPKAKLVAVPKHTDSNPDKLNEAVEASQTAAQKEALKLLIYSAVLSAKVGEMVEIPRSVEAKYQVIRGTILGSIQVAAAATGVAFIAGVSANHFRSSLQPFTIFFRAIADSIRSSGQLVWDILVAIKFDKILSNIGHSIKASFEFIRPVVGLFFTKGFGISVATSGGSSVVAGSSYMMIYPTSDGVLSSEAVRSLLGYDEGLMAQINQTTAELAEIYQISPENQSKYKELLFNKILDEAVKENFQDHAKYNIDVVQILEDAHIITVEQAFATNTLKELVKNSTSPSKLSESELSKLAANVDAITSLCAILESFAKSGKLSIETEKEVYGLLAAANRSLDLIKMNFDLVPENKE